MHACADASTSDAQATQDGTLDGHTLPGVEAQRNGVSAHGGKCGSHTPVLPFPVYRPFSIPVWSCFCPGRSVLLAVGREGLECVSPRRNP